MSKITFDSNEEGGLELARLIVLERLREDSSWKSINSYYGDTGFDRYVDFVGNLSQGKTKLYSYIQDVIWELVIQGVIAPGAKAIVGTGLPEPNFPHFHITEYGQKVLDAGEFVPHDPVGYLARFRREIKSPDPTVEAYLSESLNCFTRGCIIAAVIMLGAASERAFLMLCNALLQALSDQTEQTQFKSILERNPIKPKEDWVLKKIESIQQSRPRPLPDNVNIMLTVIFDFIRCQRNRLGHPQEKPPQATREEAYVNLRIFPTYYGMLEQIIEYFKTNKV
jgi:hypothetical protein